MLMGLVLGLVGWLTSEVAPLNPVLQGLVTSSGVTGPPGFSWQHREWGDTWQPRSGQRLPLLDVTWMSGRRQLLFWTVLGLFAGVAGSLVDSWLGATLQYSGYCHKTGRAVGTPGPFVTHISGRPWLSNEAVNALSAAIAATSTAACTWWLCT
jgi:hypothetical protein